MWFPTSWLPDRGKCSAPVDRLAWVGAPGANRAATSADTRCDPGLPLSVTGAAAGKGRRCFIWLARCVTGKPLSSGFAPVRGTHESRTGG